MPSLGNIIHLPWVLLFASAALKKATAAACRMMREVLASCDFITFLGSKHCGIVKATPVCTWLPKASVLGRGCSAAKTALLASCHSP